VFTTRLARVMLCPRCYGTHIVQVNGRRDPCPECAGVGEIHCCDGLQEQPVGCERPAPPVTTTASSDR
jgi:hypothetical protein